jgi:hypothetical protein
MKTAQQIIEPLIFPDKVVLETVGEDIRFVSANDAINAMEKYAKEYHESRRMQVINECKDELLKHMFLMKHTNGYPSKAVPHATILELPALMNNTTHKNK